MCYWPPCEFVDMPHISLPMTPEKKRQLSAALVRHGEPKRAQNKLPASGNRCVSAIEKRSSATNNSFLSISEEQDAIFLRFTRLVTMFLEKKNHRFLSIDYLLLLFEKKRQIPQRLICSYPIMLEGSSNPPSVTRKMFALFVLLVFSRFQWYLLICVNILRKSMFIRLNYIVNYVWNCLLFFIVAPQKQLTNSNWFSRNK